MDMEEAFPRLSSKNKSEDEEDLKKKVDDVLDEKESEWEDTFSKYQEMNRQLHVKAMAEAQRKVLREVMEDMVEMVEDRTDATKEELEEMVENRTEELEEEIESNAEKIDDLEETHEEDTEELEENIKESNKDLLERIDSTKEKLNERIDSNRSLFRKKSDTLTDKIDEATLKLKSIEETETPEALSEKVETLSEKVEKVEEESREADNAGVDTDEVVEKVRERLEVEKMKQIEESNDDEEESSALTPGKIDESMEGRKVKVEGNLEFRKKVKEYNFYKMSEKGEHVIVRSKDRIPSGRHVFDGTVKKIKGNLVVDT
ncbi:MAG: hypothetical protein H8Z69_04270 [Nanohaloarchaea archaeon]|nr:hypothetical protein [Candidatus Nanohaloarchaea archaeon]